MIGCLKGVVECVGNEDLILDVNGVGYLVGAGSGTLSRLAPGQSAIMHIETYVREDAFRLFGFLEDVERAWFVRLQLIQGVGAKAALAILDSASVEELTNAAALGDTSTFSRAKGVGPKLATRIATELKDKAPPVSRYLSAGLPSHAPSAPSSTTSDRSPDEAGHSREDAVSALLNLGYQEGAARQAVALVLQQGEDADLSGVIRSALKELAP